jgi:tetratricopeptide (TPR) repeat protein
MNTSKPHLRLLIIAILLTTTFTGCSAQARKARQLERAERNFKAGEYDKARIDYMAVLRIEPQNATAIQRLGLIWSEGGSPLAALPFLMKTRELNPGDLVSRKKLADALVSVGDWDGAKKEAIEILRQAPSDGEALLTLAQTARTAEQFPELEQNLNAFPAKNAAEFHTVAGSIALHKNDQATAETELQQAVAADPKSPVAHIALAYLALARKDVAKVGEEFKTAAELSPFRSIARIKYADFLLTTGASDQAKVLLSELIAKAPDYIPAWRVLSQIALSQKNYKDALALLDNVFSRNPQDVDARVLQSNILIAKGEPKKAVELLEKLDGAYGNRIPGIKLQLARAAMADNNRMQAETALNQAIAANPAYADAIVALAELNTQSGRSAEAVTALTELLKKRPDLPQARIVLAGAYVLLGQFEFAGAVLREQLHFWPGDARAHVLLSLVWRQQNKMPEAREELAKAAELAPGNMAIFSQIVDMDLAEKNFTAAFQRVRELMQKEPQSAAAQFLEAKVYFAQADYPAAETALQKVLALDANLLEAYNLLVAIYVATNRLPEAVKQAEGVVARQPENLPARMTLALLMEKMKKFAEAADAYGKLLARSPAFVPALNNLAYLYAEYLNQPEKAVEIARKARTAEPADPSVADTLGWALFKHQDYPPALALLQESAEKLTTVPEVQFHLGMARYMMGQPDAAKAAFEQALKAPADFAGKEEAQRRLALLNAGAGQQALSREALEKLLAEQPADIVGWMRLGEIYEAEKNLPKAAEAYERARQLNPNLLAPNLKLAQFNAGFLQNKEKAIELAKKSRELAPNDPAVAGTLGVIVLRAGNYQWAYSLLQGAAREKSADASVLHSLAWAAYSLGKVAEARQAMQKASDSAAPDSPEKKDAENFLALTAIEEDPSQVGPIEQRSKNTLDAQPDYVPALMARAALQMQRGDAAQAAATYSEILRRYPDFAPAQRELAAAYSQSPDSLGKASELAARARKSLPADARIARILAEISFKRKEFGYAIQLFQESARKQPLDAVALYQLGIAELETTKTADGLNHLRGALAAGLDNPFAADAQRRIAEAQKK